MSGLLKSLGLDDIASAAMRSPVKGIAPYYGLYPPEMRGRHARAAQNIDREMRANMRSPTRQTNIRELIEHPVRDRSGLPLALGMLGGTLGGAAGLAYLLWRLAKDQQEHQQPSDELLPAPYDNAP